MTLRNCISDEEADAYMRAVYPRKSTDKFMLCIKMTPSQLRAVIANKSE